MHSLRLKATEVDGGVFQVAHFSRPLRDAPSKLRMASETPRPPPPVLPSPLRARVETGVPGCAHKQAGVGREERWRRVTRITSPRVSSPAVRRGTRARLHLALTDTGAPAHPSAARGAARSRRSPWTSGSTACSAAATGPSSASSCHPLRRGLLALALLAGVAHGGPSVFLETEPAVTTHDGSGPTITILAVFSPSLTGSEFSTTLVSTNRCKSSPVIEIIQTRTRYRWNVTLARMEWAAGVYVVQNAIEGNSASNVLTFEYGALLHVVVLGADAALHLRGARTRLFVCTLLSSPSQNPWLSVRRLRQV